MSTSRFILTLATIAVLVVAGRVSVSAALPAPWSPFPFAVVIPVFCAMEITCQNLSLRWIPQAIPILIGPVLLFAWNPGLLAGASEVPRRTLVGLLMLSVLAVGYFVLGWVFGVSCPDRISAIAGSWRSFVVVAILLLSVQSPQAAAMPASASVPAPEVGERGVVR